VIRWVGRKRLSAEVASEFVRTCNQYRIDERLGENQMAPPETPTCHRDP
jgi:hypothetical protein